MNDYTAIHAYTHGQPQCVAYRVWSKSHISRPICHWWLWWQKSCCTVVSYFVKIRLKHTNLLKQTEKKRKTECLSSTQYRTRTHWHTSTETHSHITECVHEFILHLFRSSSLLKRIAYYWSAIVISLIVVRLITAVLSAFSERTSFKRNLELNVRLTKIK